MLQRLRQLRAKNTKLVNSEIRGVTGGVAAPPEPDDAETEERKGMAAMLKRHGRMFRIDLAEARRREID
jgi:hypothetical protein